MIFTNLLAMPPPYGGRDIRVNQVPLAGKSPTSLRAFVDLKASCLAVLETCRQVYLEAFPIFYASKSYYLANSQDSVKLLELGQYLHGGPRRFRVDTIISLCLKDLTTTRPKWRPQDVDHLISIAPSLDRARLEAELHTELDSKLMFQDLEGMKSLRKICLCMRVGQELHYLRFLFGIEGLKRGVVEFVDNCHWAVRSQSVSQDHWSLQYTPFPTGFYRRGKHYEMLDYADVRIQREVLDIDSRASDLVEGDERWVEVDIGSRNYKETLPQTQPVPVIVATPVLENQQDISDGEAVESATDDGSDHESEPLQEQQDGDTNSTGVFNDSNWESDEPQEQPDGEEDGTQADNEQDQGSGDLEQQPDDNSTGSRTERENDLESGYAQGSADARDHNPPPEFDTNRVLETPQGSANEDRARVPDETARQEETENLGAPVHIEYSNTLRPHDSDTELEGSMGIPEGRVVHEQGETNHSHVSETVPEVGTKNTLGDQPTENTQATTELSLGLLSYDYRDAQTQTESADPRYRKTKMHFANTVNDSTLKTDREIPHIPQARLHLPRCERALGIMLALALLYIVVYAEEDSMLEQLLALFLFVLVLIATLGSESD